MAWSPKYMCDHTSLTTAAPVIDVATAAGIAAAFNAYNIRLLAYLLICLFNVYRCILINCQITRHNKVTISSRTTAAVAAAVA